MKAVFRLAVLLCVALALCGCGRSASYRYKLTLSLDTPDGVKTGFNVVELSAVEVSIPARGLGFKMTGQALYLDLGPGRRPLIALLTRIRRVNDRVQDIRWSDGPGWSLFQPCFTKQDNPRDSNGNSLMKMNEIAACREVITLAPADLPDLVTFADVNNPESVELVDPNDLETTLGPGASWRSMTLQATDEPPTDGLEKRLPWLGRNVYLKLDVPNIWPSVGDPRADDHVGNHNFIR